MTRRRLLVAAVGLGLLALVGPARAQDLPGLTHEEQALLGGLLVKGVYVVGGGIVTLLGWAAAGKLGLGSFVLSLLRRDKPEPKTGPAAPASAPEVPLRRHDDMVLQAHVEALVQQAMAARAPAPAVAAPLAVSSSSVTTEDVRRLISEELGEFKAQERDLRAERQLRYDAAEASRAAAFAKLEAKIDALDTLIRSGL